MFQLSFLGYLSAREEVTYSLLGGEIRAAEDRINTPVHIKGISLSLLQSGGHYVRQGQFLSNCQLFYGRPSQRQIRQSVINYGSGPLVILFPEYYRHLFLAQVHIEWDIFLFECQFYSVLQYIPELHIQILRGQRHCRSGVLPAGCAKPEGECYPPALTVVL